jgi:hypothetical protein
MQQLAYLRYMGVQVPEDLDETGAETLARKLDHVESYEEWRALVDRKYTWRTNRFLLHPKLFRAEFEVFYHQELPSQLKTFVFHHAPPTIRRISLPAVQESMKNLSAKVPGWWHQPRYQERFLEQYLKDEADRPAPAEPGPPQVLWHQFKELLAAFTCPAPGLPAPATPRMQRTRTAAPLSFPTL